MKQVGGKKNIGECKVPCIAFMEDDIIQRLAASKKSTGWNDQLSRLT